MKTTADEGLARDMDCVGARVEYCWRGTAYEAIVQQDDDGFFSYRVCRLVTEGDEWNLRDRFAFRATRVEVHSTKAVFHDVDGALSDARQAIVDHCQDGE